VVVVVVGRSGLPASPTFPGQKKTVHQVDGESRTPGMACASE
jgi:hypothetical protein